MKKERLCDGIKHCADGADERAENCKDDGTDNKIIGKITTTSLLIPHIFTQRHMIKPNTQKKTFYPKNTWKLHAKLKIYLFCMHFEAKFLYSEPVVCADYKIWKEKFMQNWYNNVFGWSRRKDFLSISVYPIFGMLIVLDNFRRLD